MFERFTDRARRVVVLSQEEARDFRHNYIGTEHLLLACAHEGDGVAGRALAALGVSQEMVRNALDGIIGEGQVIPSGHIPFTPRSKRVLELSLREALQLGHNYIGTEHLLLGIIREGDGVACQILKWLGVAPTDVRCKVIELLSGYHDTKGSAVGETSGWVVRKERHIHDLPFAEDVSSASDDSIWGCQCGAQFTAEQLAGWNLRRES